MAARTVPPAPHVHSVQGGVALAECLLAATILAVGLLGLAALQTATVRAAAGAEARRRAADLGNGALERILAEARSGAAEPEGAGGEGGAAPPPGFVLELVRTAPGAGGPPAFRAQVTWNAGAGRLRRACRIGS